MTNYRTQYEKETGNSAIYNFKGTMHYVRWLEAKLDTPIPWAVMVNPDFVTGRGYFERDGHRGYTFDWKDAGRFSMTEAKDTEERSNGKYTAIPLPFYK